MFGQEDVDFVQRRRQPDQVEVDTPQPTVGLGGGGRRPLFLFEPGQDEAIDPVSWPGAIDDGGRRRALQRPESPMARFPVVAILSGKTGNQDEQSRQAEGARYRLHEGSPYHSLDVPIESS